MNVLNLSDYNIEQNKIETNKIQQVLDEATAAGGLTVVVPRGVYMAGTLNLGSASLYLEKGAVLKASPDFADYRHNGFVHNEMRQTISFLSYAHPAFSFLVFLRFSFMIASGTRSAVSHSFASISISLLLHFVNMIAFFLQIRYNLYRCFVI